jgi:hypothetical protein
VVDIVMAATAAASDTVGGRVAVDCFPYNHGFSN